MDILKDCNIGRKPPPADPHREYLTGQPEPVALRKSHFEDGACARSTLRARSHLGGNGSLRRDTAHVGIEGHAAGQGALVDNLECFLAKLEQIVAMELYVPALIPIELTKHWDQGV